MELNYEETHVLTIEPDVYWSNQSSSGPNDVEFDNDGHILICNSSNEILKFCQSGKFISSFSVGENRKIRGISCIRNGEILLTDDMRKEVLVCDDEGQIALSFTTLPPAASASSMTLGGLAVSEKDDVFVVNEEAANILRFTKDGTLLNTISYGTQNGKGMLFGPQYVAVDVYNNVFVNDSKANRVQVYRPDGQFVRSLRGCRHPGTSLEYFNQPNGIAVIQNERVGVGCQSGLYMCINQSYGPIVRRFDDKNSANGITGTRGIAVSGNIMAVALAPLNVESTVELFNV